MEDKTKAKSMILFGFILILGTLYFQSKEQRIDSIFQAGVLIVTIYTSILIFLQDKNNNVKK